jgi:hypothetical protein
MERLSAAFVQRSMRGYHHFNIARMGNARQGVGMHAVTRLKTVVYLAPPASLNICPL